MSQCQQLKKYICKASRKQRLAALYVFLAIFALWFFLFLAAKGVFDSTLLLGSCGFQQRFGLPCPGCGMTTSAKAFAQGRFITAFYTQPAAALFCTFLLITGFFTLITAVSGVYFTPISTLAAKLKIKYALLVLLVIILAAWAVTLARALAQKS